MAKGKHKSCCAVGCTNRYTKGFPQGVITFISKGWGGRTSDVHLTENWYFGEPTTR